MQVANKGQNFKAFLIKLHGHVIGVGHFNVFATF
jgi:hypothetical protein